MERNVMGELNMHRAAGTKPNLPPRADGTHDFTAPAPNVLWVTDITEFRLPCGSKAYFSAVLDCFDGRPAAWSIGPSPTARLADSSLEAACATLAPGGAAGRALRPRRALPMARLGGGLPALPPRQEHVAQGREPGQRPHGGLLRPAQERVLPLPGLGGLGRLGLHGRAQPVAPLVPLGAHIRGAGLAHAGREPQAPRLRGVGCTGKRQQSRCPSFGKQFGK